MSQSKATIERYMDGFRKGDHAEILGCLTDDVVWDMPGAFHLVGKKAFDKEIANEAFIGLPAIEVERLIEENEVVVAEGSVRCQRRDGGHLNAVFCDVFFMRNTRIARLVTYLVVMK